MAKKLGVREGDRLVVLGDPGTFEDLIGPSLPPAVTLGRRAAGTAQVIVVHVTRRRDLERRVDALLRVLDVDGGLWVAWPKRASGVPTDVTEDTVREVFLPLGLVDNEVCAIDETWSGLRVVWRRERRAERRGGAG